MSYSSVEQQSPHEGSKTVAEYVSEQLIRHEAPQEPLESHEGLTAPCRRSGRIGVGMNRENRQK
jgi:hypothetical protein